MSSPLVSIITPTYNHEAFIAQCIESVLAQTYSNWEQIIIDDGSTDKTAEIVRQYNDPRIRYFHQQNAGIEALAHTYNRALGMAKGSLVAILEGDDCWPADKLERAVAAFAEDVVLTYGLVAEVSADGSLTGRLPRRVRRRRKLPFAILRNDPVRKAIPFMMRADGVDMVPAVTVVFCKAALQEIGGFQYVPELRVVDYPTVLRMALLGKFGYVDEVLGYRRRHCASATYAHADTIIPGARRFAEATVTANAVPISVEMRKQIKYSWRKFECGRDFERGRVYAASGDWARARKHFARAISVHDPLIMMAGTVGWILSVFEVDIEGVMSLSGRASIARPRPKRLTSPSITKLPSRTGPTDF